MGNGTLEIITSESSVMNQKEQEELNKLAKNNYKFTQLHKWMDFHFDKIFEVALKGQDYAVGIYRDPPTKPEIHYFKNKWKKKGILKKILDIFRASEPEGAFDFVMRLTDENPENTVCHTMWRYEREVILMY